MKRICWIVIGLLLTVGSLPAYAATAENGFAAVEIQDEKALLLDSHGETQAEMADAKEDSGNYHFSVAPGKIYYLCLGSPENSATSLFQLEGDGFSEPVTAAELCDSDLFRLKNDKDGSGAGLVSVAQCKELSLDDGDPCTWLQFVIANTVSEDTLTAVCDMTFTARRDDVDGRFAEGDFATISVTLDIEGMSEDF